MPTNPPTTKISITVQRVAYPPATSDPDAWYIIITNAGTAKGKMSWRPVENDTLELEGEWSVYHGEKEFAFRSARLCVPENPRDQLRYVAARTPGMGPVLEDTIWAIKGEAWQETKDGEIPRMPYKVWENLQEQIKLLHEKAEEAKTVAALMGKGATIAMAQAAWELWKLETMGVVGSDCFRLAELPGYGFKDVDKRIRKEYGIADDDMRRIRSAVIYSLRRLTDAGDTVVEWQPLFESACGMLGGYDDLVIEATKELFADGTLKAFPEAAGVAMASDWRAEHDIWEFVNA